MKKGSDYKDTDEILCPCCMETISIWEWDEYTYSYSKNRKERRDYVSLTYKKAFHRLTDVWYRCPRCSQWTRGNVLMESGCVLNKELEI